MKVLKCTLGLLAVTGLAGAVCVVLTSSPVLVGVGQAADMEKRKIESSAKNVVANTGNVSARVAIRPDVGKSAVERPTEAVVARSSTGVVTPAPTENPKVQPGLVHWHADFASACQASKKSGKPVLLFHMMGKLDDQFC